MRIYRGGPALGWLVFWEASDSSLHSQAVNPAAQSSDVSGWEEATLAASASMAPP